MKRHLPKLFVFLCGLMMAGCSHCQYGPFVKGNACLPCDYLLMQEEGATDLSERPTCRLRIRVVDDVGNAVSSDGMCPGVYIEGTRYGADAFTEVERGVFEGTFPATRACWAVLNIRTKDPKPFGRGMYRFQLIKNTDVYFKLTHWTQHSRTWNLRKPSDCITCTGDSSLAGSVALTEPLLVDQEGRSKPVLVPHDLGIKVQYSDGSPFSRPGLCAEIFFSDTFEPLVSWDLSHHGKTFRTFYSPQFVESPEMFQWTAQIRWQEAGADYSYSQVVSGGVPHKEILFRLPIDPPVKTKAVPETSSSETPSTLPGVAVVEEVPAEVHEQ